jgi:hypothetical protein
MYCTTIPSLLELRVSQVASIVREAEASQLQCLNRKSGWLAIIKVAASKGPAIRTVQRCPRPEPGGPRALDRAHLPVPAQRWPACHCQLARTSLASSLRRPRAPRPGARRARRLDGARL